MCCLLQQMLYHKVIIKLYIYIYLIKVDNLKKTFKYFFYYYLRQHIFSEFEEFESYLAQYKVMRYMPSLSEISKFKDGGIAIIDQIICSHAR